MNLLWLRTLSIRALSEWRRFHNARQLIQRVMEIHRTEGSRGLRQRLRFLTRKNQISGAQKNKLKPKLFNKDGTSAPSVMAHGALLIGHPHEVLGVGENLRAISCALKSSQIPYQICDAFDARSAHIKYFEDFSERIKTSSEVNQYLTNLFCLNANEMDMALSYLGPDLFSKAYNIGLWMWELSEFPHSWVGNFRYVNEIWAQSRFVQESISKKSTVPVIWMPQVVEPGPADPQIAKLLGISNDKFTFLCFFDFRSHVARKNPRAVLEAFRLAFGNTSEPVSLVIKMHGMKHSNEEYKRLIAEIQDLDNRIIIIEKILTDREIKGLISGCDAFVSLHRSEGFGRGIAEAMYYGKPTITTGYSGNMDFCNNFNSCLVDYNLIPVKKDEYPFWSGQFWAEPNIEHAASLMKQLYRDRDLCRRLGNRGQVEIRETHGAASTGRRMRERLATLNLI